MFQLTPEEAENLRSQSVISSWGGRRYLPYAFTEQGVAMLSSVLRSERAVQINIEIMRVFVRLRRVMSTREDLIRRLDELEERYDARFKAVFDTLRKLMAPPQAPSRRIGFGKT
jgi:propanediol dehydratase small subunit